MITSHFWHSDIHMAFISIDALACHRHFCTLNDRYDQAIQALAIRLYVQFC